MDTLRADAYALLSIVESASLVWRRGHVKVEDCESLQDYPDVLTALRQNFGQITAEFLKSYGKRGGKLTPEEEEYSGRQGWWCWSVWSAVLGWEKDRHLKKRF